MIDVVLRTPHEIRVFGGEELAEWRERVKTPVPGAKYTPQYRMKGPRRWDGYYRPGTFLRPIKNQEGRYWLLAGRGLLDRLRMSFPDARVNGYPPVPDLKYRAPDGLRDLQIQALDAIRRHHYIRIAYATNAGKGAVIGLAAEAAARMGHPALILCDEVEVFRALAGELEKWTGLEPGLVEAGAKYPPRIEHIDDCAIGLGGTCDCGAQLVVLAMVGTLYKRLIPPYAKDAKGKKTKKRELPGPEHVRWREWMAGFRMVLLDEADKATADTWQLVVDKATGTWWRAGFSGSFPEEGTSADWQLEELIGPVATRQVRNIELIERGISARPVVLLHPFRTGFVEPDEDVWRRMGGPERRQYVFEEAIMRNTARHAYIASMLDPNMQSAIIVNRVDHGHELARFIPNAVFLWGDAPKAEREEVLRAFQRGDLQTLIVTKILDRGSNRLGNAAGLIFASGEGSHRQTLQRIGRGLRRTDTKRWLYLMDIIDSGHPFLHKAARQRMALYHEQGFDVRMARSSASG